MKRQDIVALNPTGSYGSVRAGLVESEAHFLLHCTKYDSLRLKFNVVDKVLLEIMNQDDLSNLGSFLLEAFSTRNQV